MWCAIVSTTYVICLILTIYSYTAACLRKKADKRPHAGTSGLTITSNTQTRAPDSEFKKASVVTAKRLDLRPLAATPPEEKPPRSQAQTKSVMNPMSVTLPQDQQMGEGCDDYLNKLGEASAHENPRSTQRTRTERPDLPPGLMKTARDKNKKSRVQSEQKCNTMEGVPTIK
uniref:Uncharacterized protein n=1 Tax=Haemonchus contortus TaxID=6289 RepID=A0A7I4Y1B0_HAECO